jgi:hypothetical protein
MSILWYYVYSPKYEIFHHILSSCIEPHKGFDLRPVFVPQEAFSNTYSSSTTHFFSGNSVKIQCLIDALKANPEQHIIFSDVDLIIQTTETLRSYLESYKVYDITFMKDNMRDNTRNIGFGLIKSTPETIHFFDSVLNEIVKTKGLDQDIINTQLASFKGTSSMFTLPEIIQSNMFDTYVPFYVLQMLCANQDTSDKNIFEKLITAAKLLDITDVLPLVSNDVVETLRWYFKTHYPSHYLSQL